MTITGRFSLSHDSLARSVFSPEFLTKNPDFEYLRGDIEQCRQNYQDEVKKKGCACRVDSSWAAPCLSLILPALAAACKTNHDMIRRFIRFVAKKPEDINIDGLGVNVVYGDKIYDIAIEHTSEEVAADAAN